MASYVWMTWMVLMTDTAGAVMTMRSTQSFWLRN